MRKLFTLLTLLYSLTGFGQAYNNEWIKPSQTYYKLKIGSDGLYRIPQTTLASLGFSATPAEQFQLWRNGKQIPLYTSSATGALPGSGYIEFWGQGNDGKPDAVLYRDPAYQHVDKINLINDTSVYFLTVNSASSNQRITDAVNNVAGNTLSAEPYFMYTYGKYWKARLNPGYAAVVGEYVYSSSFDKGEFWGSATLSPSGLVTDASAALYPYNSGPNVNFRFGAVGNALNARTIQARINGSTVKDTTCDYFNDLVTSTSFPVSVISSGNANLEFDNTSAVSTDRCVISFYEMNYPRQFNFGGQNNFSFSLPGRSQGYFLQITNFNYGGAAPVLYDYTYQVRYTGDLSTPGTVKFALPAAAQDRQLILISEDASAYVSVAPSSFVTKNFIDFTNTANQGNYLIISNKALFGNGNPVEAYRQYRASAAGGGFNAKIIDIDELVDQFAFGITKHPLSIKNFLRFARAKFAVTPEYVFLFGHGATYYDYRSSISRDSDPLRDQLNLVPTWGWPASDIFLSSPNSLSPIPVTPIGRLSVISTTEAYNYLQKVQEYESVQLNSANTIEGRAWMKNVLQLTGASDNSLGPLLCSYMGSYAAIISDTLIGANVTQFCKSTTSAVELIADDLITKLFEEGIGLVNYFGHSSATVLEYNLDNPQNYNNQGKYPIFSVNGCNAGNFFAWDASRPAVSSTMSEKFIIAKQRGSVAYLASTHYGIVNYLNIYLTGMYNLMSSADYGASIGRIQKDAADKLLQVTGSDDYYARLHAEEMTLNGDPALKFYYQALPDYDIEESQVKINPQFIAISANNFTVGIKMYNLGKAVKDSIVVDIQQQYPNNTRATLLHKKIPGIKFADSLTLPVQVVSSRDKGLNKLIITLDADNAVTEVTEINNSVTKEFYIYEDEARPAFPYNYAILNQNTSKFYASTADPFTTLKQYVIEIDTTESFNSGLKVSKTISSTGGVLEFDPAITFLDSTVYYWRTSYIPSAGGDYHWNVFSFIYMSGSSAGFNQSHYYQQLETDTSKVSLGADRKWKFGLNTNTISMRNGIFGISAQGDADLSTFVNGKPFSTGVCTGHSIVFNVIDPVRFATWKYNVDFPAHNNLFLYNSLKANCDSGRYRDFEYSYMTTAGRKAAMDFMDVIPNGYYVMVRSFDTDNPNSFSTTWRSDTALWGHDISLYHKLLQTGFLDVDSINNIKDWVLFYRKGDPTYPAAYKVSTGTERVQISANCYTTDTVGYITSPVFGPAKGWKQVHWRGTSMESPSGDNPSIEVIGIAPNGTQSVLYTLDKNTQDFDISAVIAAQYPNIQLRMRNVDSVDVTPYQMSYWRVNYDPVPEGALIPNLYFKTKNVTQKVDSLELGEMLTFGIAFKNISNVPFDSIKMKVNIIDRNNVPHIVVLPKTRPLIVGDSVHLDYVIDTKDYAGMNTLYVYFNPDNDQPEQYLFNNFLYRNFYVKPDNTSPLLDVTFDNVHILNRDIVSAKPRIQIKLKDEAKYMLLNDTSDMVVQVQFPDNTIRTYAFDGDTLRFTPASNGANNTASIDFNPQFLNQINPEGDEYVLIVSGKDRSNNQSGTTQYRVTFRVIGKPMISNLLNYPNPFTTSTAFVFTITGSEVPQNMKIQILTITGKIVREITKEELGPLHIGRNITEFKWNGTDQYGQRLGNGVYIYRFVTQLNGQKMDKYKAEGDKTDRYFNNGYGKMYLMK